MKQVRYLFILILGVIASVFVACNDDETFTTSPNNRLEFSKDTLRMDTIFSRVPTSTKTFWVYNRSGSGIRLANVKLENGNQTGFRVNVDGIYLGASNGYQVSGLEVRNKDSIQVFVELTSSNNGLQDPKLIEDNLIFTLESGVIQKVNLNAYSWDAEIIDHLIVDQDRVLHTQKPIIIQKGIEVKEGITLTIGAGTRIFFAANAGLDVYGRLKIEGNADSNVELRGNRTDRMFDYLPYDRVSGQWRGIRFYETSYDNKIVFADIHSTQDGIVCDSADVTRQKLTMEHSIIHNCKGRGIYAINAKIDITNCQITNTLSDCAFFVGGNITMSHCTLAQFYPFDSKRGYALSYTNAIGEKIYPLLQLNVTNSLLTGYAKEEVKGFLKEGQVANYCFDHCVLRVPQPETIDENMYKTIYWENEKDTVGTGKNHFVKVDHKKQAYDFHLSKQSIAINKGYVLPMGKSHSDRDGKIRVNAPDLGCYEFEDTGG